MTTPNLEAVLADLKDIRWYGAHVSSVSPMTADAFLHKYYDVLVSALQSHIEAQQPETVDNKSTALALSELIYEITHLSPQNLDGSHDCRVSRQALDMARKALQK